VWRGAETLLYCNQEEVTSRKREEGGELFSPVVPYSSEIGVCARDKNRMGK
jgi:hypothetical protein